MMCWKFGECNKRENGIRPVYYAGNIPQKQPSPRLNFGLIFQFTKKAAQSGQSQGIALPLRT
jgi:hypothetical protein